jgi:hypothetical protein
MSSIEKAQDRTKDPTPMKPLIFCLALISLAVAQKPMMQKDRQVLFDFRGEDERTPAKIAPATQKWFYRKYFVDTSLTRISVIFQRTPARIT